MENKKLMLFVGMFLLMAVGLVSASTTHTSSTDTTCNQVDGEMICTKTIYSGTTNVFEDGEWKKVKDAKSLKGSGIVPVILEDDPEFPVEIVDYNYDSIKVKLNPSGIKIFNENIPLRLWKENQTKEAEYEQDIKDGKKIKEDKEKEYKEKMDKVYDSEIGFNLLNQEEEITLDFGIGDILEFGYNSTTIQLQDADTENLEDSSLGTGLHNVALIKFNISAIPSGSEILDSSLNVYLYAAIESEGPWNNDINIYRIGNQSWTEDDSGIFINATWQDSKTDLDSTQTINTTFEWKILNVTTKLQNEYSLGSKNFSIGLEDPDYPSSPTQSSPQNDNAVFLEIGLDFISDTIILLRSKEATNISERPYLNITYSSPPLAISITSPTNTTYTTIPTTLNWTVGGAEEEACWYSNNSGATNTTVTCGDLQTSISPVQGSNTYFMWVNDSSSNEVTDNVTFFVDFISPVLNITNPLSSFIWYGWDTDGTNTITVDLNWTTVETNLDKCWYYNNSANVSVTCGDNATMIIPYGTYNWKVYANDTANNVGTDSQTTKYSALINNSHTGNTSTYETKSETFAVNVTYPSAQFTVVSAILNYSGTSYAATRTGTGDTAVFTKTLDIPTIGATAVNKTYFFNITLNNGTNLYYSTDQRNITVNPITFQKCNGTYETFLNYTFKDEELDTFIEASVPSATFQYWLGSGGSVDEYFYTTTVDSYNQAFCFSLNETLHTDIEFQYKQDPGYNIRTESYVGDLSNATTNKLLYLTGTANGHYITFQLQNQVGTNVADASIQVERQVLGAWTVVSTDNSDDAGQVAFYLDITLDHRLTVTHEDYITEILTIKPSQSFYTITLSSEAESQNDSIQGIDYSILPTDSYLENDTEYTFGLTLTSSHLDVSEYGFNLRLANGTIITGDSSTILGTALTKVYDTTNQSIVYFDYYWIIADEYTNASIYWIVQNTEYTEYSIKSFFTHLSEYLDSGIFGLGNFGRNLIVFLILFLSLGIMSYKYGATSPLAISALMFGIIFFFDMVVGLIPTIRGIEHLPTFLSALILTILIISEVRQ